MSDDRRDVKTLYHDLILDHGKSPRNEGALAGATHEATTKNPLCGDRVTLRLSLEGDVVREARFEARGCLIARASASLLTEAIVGKNVRDALALVAEVDALVGARPQTERDREVEVRAKGTDANANANANDARLAPLAGARDFPARRACVTLAWRALETALRPSDR